MGLRSISLFSGIAGLDIGVKLACPDVRTVCYVERDEFCQRILQARMADGSIDDAPIWDDVTTFDGHEWRGRVDLITGGFPCQDISNAGKRAGIDGKRSGLWREYVRIIREVRPRFVFVENVSALLGRGLERVLGDLAESGFDAEWGVLSACAVGAPHSRERVFLLAYSDSVRQQSGVSPRRTDHRGSNYWQTSTRGWRWQDMECWLRENVQDGDWREPAAEIQRMDDGIPDGLDRLRALGNAVVPQQAAVAFAILWRRMQEGVTDATP